MSNVPTFPSPAPDAEIVRRQQDLELALRHNPADRKPYLELAQVYRVQQRHYDAIRVLERASTQFPEDQELKWELEESLLARALQRLEQAREDARLRPAPDTEEQLARARTEWGLRRADVCRARLGRDPGQPALMIVLAEAYRDIGRYEEALQQAQRAINTSAEIAPKAHLIQGQCWIALKQPLDAMASLRAAAFRRATPAVPKIKEEALRMVANLALQQGLYASAQRYLSELKLLLPDDPAIAKTLNDVKQLTVDSEDELAPSLDLQSL